jgi:hypothetical protein
MTRISGFARVLGLGAVAALLAAGCATAPPGEAKLAASAPKAKADAKEFCVRDTGSRIKPSKDQCMQSGRTYTREDLDNTGAIDAADALRRLDPRL